MEQTELDTAALIILKQYDGPCPHCGFHLSHPQSNKCSECGAILVLSLSKPFRCTSWLLFAFGFIASIGVCVDQVGLFVAARIINGSPFIWGWILPEVILTIVLFVGLCWWWKVRSWALGLSPTWKWVIGGVGLAMPFFWFVALFTGFYITF